MQLKCAVDASALERPECFLVCYGTLAVAAPWTEKEGLQETQTSPKGHQPHNAHARTAQSDPGLAPAGR